MADDYSNFQPVSTTPVDPYANFEPASTTPVRQNGFFETLGRESGANILRGGAGLLHTLGALQSYADSAMDAFGKPDPAFIAKLNAIRSKERLPPLPHSTDLGPDPDYLFRKGDALQQAARDFAPQPGERTSWP